jgi:hypothetical protein
LINLKSHNSSLTLLWILLSIVLFAYGFWSIYSYFLWYDDEGYIMISVKGVLDGHSLYTEVYSQYGPVFFQFYEMLYRIFPIDLNHDSNRMVSLIGWLVTSGLAARLMFRIHGSQLLSVISFIVVFLFLEVTVKEPGHPQQLCFILTLLALLLTTGFRAVISAFLVGSLIAMLVLTKVNLGFFLGLVVLASTFSVTYSRSKTVLASALLMAFFAFGYSVLSSQFSSGSFSLLATLFLSATAIGVTKREAISVPGKVIGAFVGGAVLTAGLSVGYSFLNGTQATDLFWSVVTQHTQLTKGPDILYSALGVVIASFGLLGALVYKYVPKFGTQSYLNKAKVFYGLAVLAVVLVGFASELYLRHVWGNSVRGNADLIWWLAPGFAWLYSASNQSAQKISRLGLSFASVIFILGAYPVPGSQVSYSTVLLILVALGCLHDASNELSSFGRLKLNVIASNFLKLVVCILFITGFFKSVSAYQAYEKGVRIEFPGSKLIRLPVEQAELFTDLVDAINKHCSSFITIYGVNSLYFWTGQQPPTWWNLTVWPYYLTVEMQHDMISQMEKETEPCVIEDSKFNYLKTPHVQTKRGLFGQYVVDSYVEYWRVGPYVAYRKK